MIGLTTNCDGSHLGRQSMEKTEPYFAYIATLLAALVIKSFSPTRPISALPCETSCPPWLTVFDLAPASPTNSPYAIRPKPAKLVGSGRSSSPPCGASRSRHLLSSGRPSCRLIVSTPAPP